MNNQTSIQVSAQGNFQQLIGQLSQLQQSLNGVQKTVNTPLNSNSFFNQNTQRTIYASGRGSSSYGPSSRLSAVTIGSFSSAALAQLTQAIQAATSRNQPTQSQPVGQGSGSGGGTSSASNNALNSVASSGLNKLVGTFAKVAGVSLGLNQLMQWEQMAETANANWQPLLQRTGANRSQMEQTGIRYGYNSMQTRGILDAYSQAGGGYFTGSDASSLMGFSRAWGVDPNTAAAVAGQMAGRGYGGPGTTLSNVAGIANSSGMGARILEVLETSQGFLQSMDKNLKDNSGNSLLAYTARLNQIGTSSGAMKLTGQSGANILEQMGNNIFDPNNTSWLTLGTGLLQKFGGASTKGKGVYDLMGQWENGFGDPTNVSVLSQYLGGLNPISKTEVLRQAMGGNTTIGQAQQFGQLTNWLKDFNPNDPKMAAFLNGGAGANGGTQSKLSQWNGSITAKIETTNAQWTQAQLDAGSVLIPIKLDVEDKVSTALDNLANAINKSGFTNMSPDNQLVAAVGTVAGGYAALKGVKALLTPQKGSGKGGASGADEGGGVGGANEGGGTTTLDGGFGGFLSSLFRGFAYSKLNSDIQNAYKNGYTDPLTGSKYGPMQNELFGGLTSAQYTQYHDMQMKGTLPDGVKTAQDYYDYLKSHADTQTQSIDKLQKDGNKSITKLQEDGSSNLSLLWSSGASTFQKMYQTVDMGMQSILDVFKTKTADAATTSGNGSTYTGPAGIQGKPPAVPGQFDGMQIGTMYKDPSYSSTYDSGLTAAQANQILKGTPMAGEGSQFIKAGDSYGIDPLLLLGIAGAEQSFSPYNHNAFGLMTGANGTIGAYKSDYDGMLDAAKTLADYAKGGVTSLTGIQQKWAPVGAGNDPNNLNSNWLSNVKSYMGRAVQGHADGAFISHDQVGLVHGGEEIISRSKTGEILRKTGMKPSQLLNRALNGGGSVVVASGGGTSRTYHHVHITGDGNAMQSLDMNKLSALVGQMINEHDFNQQRGQVVY